ncbi:ABC transporter permease [Usitatibacter palustris]|uniref:Transport permease protein n=1 Tax=Usitatibacter palustris TaxID=2732487 RepID=A0A6M4HEP9_9PROT|nr:ABC transporter permease [Usitatibacter palustris]QJR16487.1 Teichoic acid translocation permease protein TagG [Usitatibacter palustris]
MNFHPASPAGALRSLRDNRELVWELVKRDFIGRYRGSFAGVAWSLFNPLLMLAIYTFVFTIAFNARWGPGTAVTQPFAVILFAGMLVFNLFAETLIRAPTLITSQPNYVKKIVFPIDVLAWVVLCSAVLHFLVGFGVLLLIAAFIGKGLSLSVVLTPVVLMPLLLFSLGLTWILASLGVYLRDVPQVVAVLVTVLMFVSPIFYPLEVIPEKYRLFLTLNPLAVPIEQFRSVALWGKPIDWQAWGLWLAVDAIVFCAGYWWFQRTRKGFADVL